MSHLKSFLVVFIFSIGILGMSQPSNIEAEPPISETVAIQDIQIEVETPIEVIKEVTPIPTQTPKPSPVITKAPSVTKAPVVSQKASIPVATDLVRQYAYSKVESSQQACLESLWGKESGWQAGRLNHSSFAVGIPQALPPTKIYPEFYSMEQINVNGKLFLANPDYKREIDWGLGYITARYKTPCGALAAWQSRSPHWY